MNNRDPIECLINDMERASHAERPLAAGYGDKRAAVRDELTRLRAENEALKARAEAAEAGLARLTTPVPLEREEPVAGILWARDEDGWYQSIRSGATHFTPIPTPEELTK